MPRRYYSSTAVATTLSGNINNSTTSITVAALSGYPAQTPFTAIIDPDTASEEVVEVTNVAGTTLTVTRGVDGTTAASHNAGAVFRHGVSARDFDEANAFVNGGGVANALFTAKASLVSATAANTPATLTVGANDTVLTADSSTATGLAWKAASSLPSQTSQAGKFLTTNGTAASWVDPPTNRNLIINGAMNVHQRGTSVTSITSGDAYATADRWKYSITTLGTWTQDIQTDAPTGSGFRKSLRMLCTTAQASPAAGAYLGIRQFLEGQDLQRIRKGTADAQQLTLSFWVKSNVTGTFNVRLKDEDNTRNCSAAYTISSSATWERKTVTFPADAAGAFDNDNASSLFLEFMLGLGSNYTGSPLQSSWGAEGSASTIGTGQTNLAAATNNYWQVTGVQLETGPVATPFEFEPYEATLRKCQRYYWRETQAVAGQGATIGGNMGAAVTGAVVDVNVPFPTRMRTAPTALEVGNLAAYGWRLTTVYSTGTWTIPFSSDRSATLRYTHGTSVFTINDTVSVMSNAAGTSYIAFSAEL